MKNRIPYLIFVLLFTAFLSMAQNTHENTCCKCLDYDEIYFKKIEVNPTEFGIFILLFDSYFTNRPTEYIQEYFETPYLEINGNGRSYKDLNDKREIDISDLPEDVFMANSLGIFGDFAETFLSKIQKHSLETFFKKIGIDKIHKKKTIFLQTYWRYKNCQPLNIEQQIEKYEY